MSSGTLNIIEPGGFARLSVWSHRACTIVANGLIRTKTGQISQFELRVVHPGTQTVRELDKALPEGVIQSVLINTPDGTPVHGECYARLVLVKGQGAGAVEIGTICAGYLTNRSALGGPGFMNAGMGITDGSVQGIMGSAPAAGASATLTCKFWELLQVSMIEVSLVTDATVASRQVRITMTEPGGASAAFYMAQGSQAASLTRTYRGLFWGYGVTLITPDLILPGAPFDFTHDCVLTASASSIQAGDQFSGITIAGRMRMMDGPP